MYELIASFKEESDYRSSVLEPSPEFQECLSSTRLTRAVYKQALNAGRKPIGIILISFKSHQ